MDYRKYLDYRQSVLASWPGVIDAGDLDFYGKFDRAVKVDGLSGHKNGNIHRCHLVEDFLRVYNLDVDKGLIGFSEGVRHTLSVLMEEFKDRKWLLPNDNYPFYLETARVNSLKYETFATLQTGSLADLRDSKGAGDILLLTYPLKPSGNRYSMFDWAFLRAWLGADSKRMILIDAVYSFDLSEEKELLEFFNESDQVTILYSLSKVFSSPRTAGFTFTRNEDIRNLLKALPRDDEKMELSYSLLNSESGIRRSGAIRDFVRERFSRAVALELVPASASKDSYLFYVPHGASTLLDSGIIAIPVSVFGSFSFGSVISTLSLPHP